MSLVHLHLMLNHAPVIGVVFAALLLAAAVLRHSDELTKAAFGFLVLLGAVTVVVFATGGSAEQAIEKLPAFSREITERHEDAAIAATIAMVAIGVLALIALVVYRRRAIPRRVTLTGIVAVLAAIGVVGYVANLGGQIRHTEIRADASSAPGVVQATDARNAREHR
jgi:TRAP-type C4-dicarboxylate transport system permease small subunit